MPNSGNLRPRTNRVETQPKAQHDDDPVESSPLRSLFARKYVPAKPIYKGGTLRYSAKGTPMRFTNDQIYLGPEREIKTAPLLFRWLGTAYYVICICILSMLMTLALALAHTYQYFKRSYLARFADSPRKEKFQADCDFVLGLIHETVAAIMSKSMAPVLYMEEGPAYPLIDEMTFSLGPDATEEEFNSAKEELKRMKGESKQRMWNRIRVALGLKDLFILTRGFIMSNHLSNADGVIGRGISFPSGAKILYKGSLSKIPIFGWNFKLAGDIAIPFKGNSWKTEEGFREKLHAQLDRIIAHRLPVMLFPEGTRSRYRRLAPFRKGMFEYAFDNKVPIWPLALYGTQNAMPCGDALINPSNIQIMYSHQLVFPQGHTLASFTTAVRDEIILLLQCRVGEYDNEADAPIDSLSLFKDLEMMTKNKDDGSSTDTETPPSSVSSLTTPS